MITVKSRVARILRPLSNFTTIESDVPIDLIFPALNIHEHLLGIYANALLSSKELIAVTDKAILIEFDGEWIRLDYNDILSIDLPQPEELDAGSASILIRKQDETALQVPVRGFKGRLFDIYEFGRFLMRVTKDVKQT